MPEQSVPHQENVESEQQINTTKIKGEQHENHRQKRSGGIQRRNCERADEKTRNVLMKTVRLLDTHEEVIGLSGHLLAVSKKLEDAVVK